MMREPAQQRAQIVAAAFAEKTAATHRVLARGSVEAAARRAVVAILAGQHGERDAALVRQCGEPLDAVFPPIEAAEQAHHDHLGMAPRRDRSTDRPTWDGAGRANAPAARSASSRAQPPRRRRARRDRCRRTTARRCRPAFGRDRPLRRFRRDWSSSWSIDASFNLQAPASPRRGRVLSIRSRPDGSRAVRMPPMAGHIDASPARPPLGPRGAAACWPPLQSL